MKIGLTALTLRPACVLGVFHVKEKENRLRVIVDRHKASALFAPPPSLELLSGDGLSRIDVDSCSLAHGVSPGLHHWCADVADCFSQDATLWKFATYSGEPGVSNKYLEMTEGCVRSHFGSSYGTFC